MFAYDVAVIGSYRRKGVGRQFMQELRENASASGIRVVFVAAENGDIEALDFYRAIGGAPTQATFFAFTQDGSDL